jgi:hypothetical protein
VLGVIVAWGPSSSAAVSEPSCDFNGDGYSDLTIPTPREDLSGSRDAGGVGVLYGSASGPSTEDDLFLSQATAGVVGNPETGDLFGNAVTCGDFDADGYQDIAVGVPGESIGNKAEAGIVVVVRGGPSGLRPGTSEQWSQGATGAPDGNGPDNRFGWSLAACDFDGDGYSDLAVAAPGADVGGEEHAGSVHVVYGTPGGLDSADASIFHQDTPKIQGAADSFDAFGYALACGDVFGDHRDDLVVGTPFDTYSGVDTAGTVTVIKGRGAGLRPGQSVRLAQGIGTIGARPETGDAFGMTVAVADFDGDGQDDIAVGAPREAIGLIHDAGSVSVIYGSTVESAIPDGWYVHRGRTKLKGTPRANAHLGWALAAADFNGDGYADLAAGAPGASVSGQAQAGDVTVLMGSDAGLRSRRDKLLSQGSPGIKGAPESDDHFGWAMSGADVDGGRQDLIVHVPGEGLKQLDDGGATFVVFGRKHRFGSESSRSIHQDRPGVAQVAETGDRAGEAPAPCDPLWPGCGHPVCPMSPGNPSGSIPLVGGTSGISGPGPVRTFSIQVESGLEIEPRCFAEAVGEILFDTRSWGARGEVAFRRVDTAGSDIQVILASPAKTDQLCYPLNTGGVLSCRVGSRVVLNALRWEVGVAPFGADLRGYQGYLVNHEVGHALGQGHRSCPAAGAPAPVMMQQSKGVGSCLPNPWPLGYELASLNPGTTPPSRAEVGLVE